MQLVWLADTPKMTNPKSRPQPDRRQNYAHFVSISTRWMDNDIYGHLNNVVYYSYFDTAVNEYLISRTALDIHNGSSIGLVVHSECDYFSSLSFPGVIDAGLRVGAIGSSSVSYEIGLFEAGEDKAAACGRFVHVYVDRESRTPKPLSSLMLAAVSPLAKVLAPT